MHAFCPNGCATMHRRMRFAARQVSSNRSTTIDSLDGYRVVEEEMLRMTDLVGCFQHGRSNTFDRVPRTRIKYSRQL